MPEVKTEALATEAPEMEGLPEGDAPFKTTEEPAAEAVEKPAEEISPEAKEMAAEVTPGDAEKVSESAEEINEVDEILAEPTTAEEDKSNVQKRIDKLTAELKSLKEENAKLAADKAQKDGKLPEYSPQQLKTALKKAMDEGDSDLVWEIMEYTNKKTRDDLVKMYNQEKNAAVERDKIMAKEWGEIVDAYKNYADTKQPEVYPGSHKELDLRDQNSLLRQVAWGLYWSQDQEKAQYYRGQPGGQKLAVADALTKILSKKGLSKPKDSEKERLKKALIKEKMKNTIPGAGSPGAEEKAAPRILSDKERLDEVIAERKKYREERGI